MRSLPLFFAVLGRPVILIGGGPTAEPKRRLLERAGAKIVGEEGAAALAIVAIEDAGEAAAAAGRLRARGVLVNVVDRPALCDFTLPAIVDRDPVLVAVGTSGVSAGLAAALRQRLETLLPAGLGRVAETLGAARARFPDPAARRRALAGLLAEGGALDPLRAHDDPAAVLAGVAEAAVAARVEAVTIASADPDDLTLRAARLLGQADRVHHPPDMAPAILARTRADAARTTAPAPMEPLPGLTVVLDWARP